MKTLLLFLIPLLCNSQTDNFIYQENKNVTWQLVYNDTIAPQRLLSQLELTGQFANLETNSDPDFTLNFNRDSFTPYGYKSMTDATLFLSGGQAKGKIEFKDNRYRVTIFNIIIYEPISGIGTLPLSAYFFKSNGELKSNKVFNRAHQLFDDLFKNTFQSKQTKSDW